MSLQISLTHAFKGFDLDIRIDAPAGVTVLFGPSGSGKSTVIDAVAGLLRPDQARIVAGDRVLVDTAQRFELAPHRRRLGYIFQDARLFPHLTVQQNLHYGRWFAPRRAPVPDPSRVIEMLGLGPLLSRRPNALSGGEKSRVAIGRALLAAPELILADEPLASLDEARKAEILPYFERLRDEVTVPFLYVSHAPAEVARLATTVVALRAGRVVASGAPAAVLGDAAAMGARGASSVLTATVTGHDSDGLSALATQAGPIWLPRIPDAPGTSLRLRIEAQDVILSRVRPEGLSALNILQGRITEIRLGDGPGALVVLAIGQDRLTARITRRSVAAMGLEIGQICHAILKSVAPAPEDIGTGRDRAQVG